MTTGLNNRGETQEKSKTYSNMQTLQNAVGVLAKDKQSRKELSTIYQNIKI